VFPVVGPRALALTSTRAILRGSSTFGTTISVPALSNAAFEGQSDTEAKARDSLRWDFAMPVIEKP
jgi:hypothetical protein